LKVEVRFTAEREEERCNEKNKRGRRRDKMV
jgi:hypothetical protein